MRQQEAQLVADEAGLAVDDEDIPWSDELVVRHDDFVDRPFDLFDPKQQELLEQGKLGGDIILLPDVLLYELKMVGHAVDDIRSGEPKVEGHLGVDFAHGSLLKCALQPR